MATNKKVKPIPVKIVSDSTAQVPQGPDKKFKPTMSFDCDPDMPMPKLGATVRVRVTGKVRSCEVSQHQWDGGKKRARMEIEYAGPSAIDVHTGNKDFDELEDEDGAI